MGLDVHAYEIVEWVGDFDEAAASVNGIRDEFVCVEDDLMRRPAELRVGCYKTSGKEFYLRAGSYSGYNRWREWLCQSMLGVEPTEIWSNPEKWAGKPFFELIHFPDDRGVIATTVCGKLAIDFLTYQDRARKADMEGFNFRLYEKWATAFILTTGRGIVEFR